MKENTHMEDLIAKAVAGNSQALEQVLLEVQDTVFNLALRMTGSPSDAEDAAQDILIKVMTNLSSFRSESSFRTWVYRIAVNYLIDYKKSMFAQHPLNFDFYANDINAGFIDSTEELLDGMDSKELASELKASCTNVMLQCFDPQTRCIFILGTMFRVDSRTAGEILEMTPENYRQKLSRARRKMAEFLTSCCGLGGSAVCCCEKRAGYAIIQHRLNPRNMEYRNLKTLDEDIAGSFRQSMEELDELSLIFEDLPQYRSTLEVKKFLNNLMYSKQFENIQNL